MSRFLQQILATDWERAMKVQEVILRAIAKQITWWQAAEIIGISDRQLRRWQRRYEEHGYTSLIDRRRGRVSERQVPLRTVEEVLGSTRSNTSISTCAISTRSW